jgi:hypothetical protein
MDTNAFAKYYQTLNKHINKQVKNLNEAESLFKGGPLVAKKTKPFFHWKHGESPAIFDIDFKFKVIFNKKKIEQDFATERTVDWDGFYHEYIKPNFSERGAWIKAKKIEMPDFKIVYVIYNSEYSDKTLNPNRNQKYQFSLTYTLEANDKNKQFKKPEIQKTAQDFVKLAEKYLFDDTDYYKITK